MWTSRRELSSVHSMTAFVVCATMPGLIDRPAVANSDMDDAASYSDSEYSYSTFTNESVTDRAARFDGAAGLVGWLKDRADDAKKSLAQVSEDLGPPVLFTPRDAPPRRKRPTRVGHIAAIPWTELVGIKESLLTHMEAGAVASERLEERAALVPEHTEVLTRTLVDMDAAIRELQQVAEVDRVETEEIAADLRMQIEQLRAEHDNVEKHAAERRAREAARADRGLMGQVAKQHEGKLVAAKTRHATAKSRLAVHMQLLSREVRAIEAPSEAAAAALAAAAAADVPAPPGFSPRRSADTPWESAVEASLASALARIEASFTHRRAPPAMRPPALLARWRRLQLGEPFELLGGGGGGSGTRVWVALSSDVRYLEIGPTKGAPPSRRIPLAEVLHMESDARRLCLHTLRGERIALAAGDAPMLVFWYAGLQNLASLPHTERHSRGALLWRAARHLWRAARRSRTQLSAGGPPAGGAVKSPRSPRERAARARRGM